MPLYAHTDSILEECKLPGVLLVVAPTGTGKTTGICGLVVRRPDVFGRTVIVQPTRAVAHATNSMTPRQLIDRFLLKKEFGCDTLVLDEAHTQCVEYHAIFSFISRTKGYEKMRIVLVSATPHTDFLEGFFPVRVFVIPVPPPYPLDIYYEPVGCVFPSYGVMAGHTEEVLQRHPGHGRVLVFLYTQDQCEKMRRDLEEFVKAYNNGKVFALHGNSDMKEWSRFMRQEEKFVVFATNIIEASSTVPGLSLVVDFGVRCIQRNHRIVYNECPQANLTQRAGRTGRTCPGVVVRCMTAENFNARPDHDNPSHNWDAMVLRVLWHNNKPEDLLPTTLDTQGILRKFRFYGILSEEGVLDRKLCSFVLRAPLTVKNSCHLYYFLTHHRRDNEALTALYALSCALIDQMETRVSRIYYHSSESKMNRNRLIEKLRRALDAPDELSFHLQAVLSCVLNEKPVQFSNAFSLNYRTIRQVLSAVLKLWAFLDKNDWRGAVRRGLRWKDQIARVEPTFLDKLRGVYMACPLTPRFLLVNDMIWRPNFIIESYNSVISPFVQIYGRNRCVLILSHDDTEIEKWADTSAVLDDITTIAFSLYTFPPSPIDKFIHNISGIVGVAHFEHNAVKKKKTAVRKKMGLVMRDIEEDVAHRPGFWRAEEKIRSFLERV